MADELEDDLSEFLEREKNRLNERKAELEDEMDDVVEEIDQLETDPDPWIKSKVERIDEKIPDLPDREPENPDNTTMKEHLKTVKWKLEEDPDKVITPRVNTLKKRERRADDRLVEVEGKLERINSDPEGYIEDVIEN